MPVSYTFSRQSPLITGKTGFLHKDINLMRILLASMPWSIFNRPSIQLGCLKSYLNNHLKNISINTLHPYLSISSSIGQETYRKISESNWAGESLYSSLLFPEQKDKAKEVFCKCLNDKNNNTTSLYDNLVQKLEKHLELWKQSENFAHCDLLGFTICFSQLLPSLYAATVIKQMHPHIRILFGGSTCTPAISASLLKSFPVIDFIITGEGEKPLVQLCKHLMTGSPLPENNIVANRLSETKTVYPQGNNEAFSEIRHLNSTHPPDYDDYFLELKQNNLHFIPTLPLEFSRGCWWNKCFFCNLNIQWLGYRHKNGNKMYQEYTALKNRYKCLDFSFTDNALPVKEADIFFNTVAHSSDDSIFFAEIRPLLNRKTYYTYKKGGLQTIQIGIEALSDSLLKKMNKGVLTIENIAAMKYAMDAGIELQGNLIIEFPGSTPEEVQDTLETIEFLLPFRPLKAATFFLGHGSHVSCNHKTYNIKSILHHPYNKKLFPPEYLSQLIFLVQSYRGNRTYQKKIWVPVRKKIAQWNTFHQQRKNWRQPALSYRQADNFLIIRQENIYGPTLHHRLKGISREIYLACETIVSKKELLRTFNSIKDYQVLAFLKELRDKKLLFSDENSVLALASRQSD